MVTKANGGSLISNSIAEATMVPMRLESRRARPTSGMSLFARALIDHLGALLFHQLVGLDHVALLDVGVAQRQTALVAVAHLGGGRILSKQRLHRDVLRDHHVVAQQPRLGITPDGARRDEATRDVADLRRPEDGADLGAAEFPLLVDRLEHALQRALDLVDGLVDHRVVADLHAVAVGQLGRLARGADVEPDDDRVRGRRQVHVGLGDATDTAIDDAQLHLVVDLDVQQGFLQRLDRAGVVALEDQVQLAGFLERRIQIFEADPLAGTGGQRVALARAAPVGDLAGDAVLVDDEEVVARTRHRREADDLHRPRRQRRIDVIAVLVDHAADATIGVACHHRGADVQRATGNQHGRHRATAPVQVRLDRHALGLHVGVGPQVQRGVGGQYDGLEQRFDVGALLGGDVDKHGVAAEFLWHQTVFGELAADLLRVGTFLVNLVDCDHDRHIGGLRVVDGLHRLRHHTVIGCDNQDRDVGGLRATGTHGGERLVARGVDEGDRPYRAVEVDLDLIGADVLGDATRLFLADVGLADGVQQSGLAVVDVAHDRHHRRTGFEVFLAALVLAIREVERFQQLAVLVLRGHDVDDVVHLAAQQLEGLVADGLRGGHHLAEVEQRLHQRGRVGVDLLGEVGQRRAAGQPDRLAFAVRQPHTADDRRLQRVVLLALLPLRLAATLRRAAGTTERAGRSATLTWPSAATAATAPATAGATTIAGTRRGATGTAGATTTGAAAAAIVTSATGTAGATTGARTGTAATGTGPGATGTATGGRAGSARTRGHIARRHAWPRRTRPRSTGTGPGTLRTGYRPVNRLRGKRVVPDARGTRGGLGRTGRGAGPRTRRSAGQRSRAGRRGCRRRRRCCRRGRRGRRFRGCRGLGGGRLLGGGPRRGGLGRRAVAVRLDLLGGRLRPAELLTQPARDGCLDCGGRGFDEFALFAQSGEDFFTGDTEFFCQLVYAGLTCHYISISRGDSGGRRRASG